MTKLYGIPKINQFYHTKTRKFPSITDATSCRENHIYVKNSERFVQMLLTQPLIANDLLERLDTPSLFPSISIEEALDVIAMNADVPLDVIELSEKNKSLLLLYTLVTKQEGNLRYTVNNPFIRDPCA